MKKKTHATSARGHAVTMEALRSVAAGDCTYAGKSYSYGSRVKMSDGSIGMCVYDPTGDKFIKVG